MIAIASDHAGFELKNRITEHFQKQNIPYMDLGCHSTEAVDFPHYAKNVAAAIKSGQSHIGILVCGTGNGIAIAANKISGIRAAVCTDTYSVKMARQHNDANILALGARVIGHGVALELVDVFRTTTFDSSNSGGRHAQRLAQIKELEDLQKNGGSL